MNYFNLNCCVCKLTEYSTVYYDDVRDIHFIFVNELTLDPVDEDDADMLKNMKKGANFRCSGRVDVESRSIYESYSVKHEAWFDETIEALSVEYDSEADVYRVKVDDSVLITLLD